MTVSDDEGGVSILDANDPHYTVIGRVATLWALLESSLNACIAELANAEEAYMACVTAQLIGPARRMDALIALFSVRGGSDALRKELKTFQGRIQQLGEDRNRVVHDPLLKGNKTGKIYKGTATAKGKLIYEFVPTSLTEMTKIVTDIQQATWDFFDLRKKIGLEMFDIFQKQLESIGVTPFGQNPQAEKP